MGKAIGQGAARAVHALARQHNMPTLTLAVLPMRATPECEQAAQETLNELMQAGGQVLVLDLNALSPSGRWPEGFMAAQDTLQRALLHAVHQLPILVGAKDSNGHFIDFLAMRDNPGSQRLAAVG